VVILLLVNALGPYHLQGSNMKIFDYVQYMDVAACCPCHPDSSPQPSLSADSKSANRDICGFRYSAWNNYPPWPALSSCVELNDYFRSNVETFTQTRTNPTSSYSFTTTKKWRPVTQTGFCSISTVTVQSGTAFSSFGNLVFEKTSTPTSFTRTIVGTLTSETEPTKTYNESHSIVYIEKITDYSAHLYNVVNTYLNTISSFNGSSPSALLDYTNYTSCTGVNESHPRDVIGRESKYRIGIPSTPEYLDFNAAHDQWAINHAAWVALPAEEQAETPEPIEPVEAKYYKCKWDEYFFPADWEVWKAKKDAYDQAVADYAAWEALPAEEQAEIPEPVIPSEPEDEPTKPNLLASRSFIWTGGSPWSPYYTLDLPTIEGESRIVNQLAYHYRSAQFGSIGTLHSEKYIPALDPPPS